MSGVVDLDALSDGPPVPDADTDLDAVVEPVRVDRWCWRLPYPTGRPPILVNEVGSPMALSSKRKKARGHLGAEFPSQFHPWGWDLVEIELVWFKGDNRAADPDGMAVTLKPCIDALADAGVIPDDKARHVHRVSQRIVPAACDPHARERGARVVLVVHKLERPEGSA